jgi:hypothetical protein
VFAEFERSIIAERVRAGVARARAEGKRLGRPPIAAELEKQIRVALDKPGRTEGVRKIAARFGVDPGTVQRISRPFAGASVAAWCNRARPCEGEPADGGIDSGSLISALVRKRTPIQRWDASGVTAAWCKLP